MIIFFFVILLFVLPSHSLKSIEEIVHESNIQTEDSTGWISVRNQKCKEIESIVWFEKLVDMLYPKEGSVQYAFYPNNSKHCSCLNDTLRLDTNVTDLFWEYGKAHILMGYKEMVYNVLILQSTMKANLHGHHKTTTTTKTPVSTLEVTTGVEIPVSTLEVTTGEEQPVSTLEVTTGAEQPVYTLETTTGAEQPVSTLETTTGAEQPVSTLETTTGAEQPVSTLEVTTGAEQPVSTLETTTGAEQPVSTLELNKATQPPMEAFSTSKSKSPSSKTSKSKSPSSKTTSYFKSTSPPKDNNHIEEMGQKHDVTKSNVVTPPADSSSTTAPNRVAIILLGSFSLLVVFVILAITIRKPAAVDPSKKQDDSVDVYGFETLDDFVVVDTKKQDQAILRSLGKGASELFDANL